MTAASNVVQVRFHETRKCPAGSLAWHAEFGLVDVLQARGWERVVRVGRPASGAPELADVHVRDLELVADDAALGVALAGAEDEYEFRTTVEADVAELSLPRDWEMRLTPPPRGTAKRRP